MTHEDLLFIEKVTNHSEDMREALWKAENNVDDYRKAFGWLQKQEWFQDKEHLLNKWWRERQAEKT